MRIGRVRLTDFRNYASQEIEPAGVTVLVGPNASGKTNLIEAVQLAASTRSFRSPEWADVVRWGTGAARVEIEAEGDSSRAEIVLDVESGGRRQYRVNGTVKRRLADVAGLVPVVVFTPDDLRLVKGSAERRRSALDDVGEQAHPAYATTRRDYLKAVRQRNRLLKDGAPDAQLEPWSQQVAQKGGRLLALRARLLARLETPLVETYAALASDESLTVDYADAQGLEAGVWRGGLSADEATAAIAATLASRSEDERARRTTLAGPHRDDVAIAVSGHDARAFASQGQQRTVALAWKIAALRTLQDVLGRRPVLLLDDVMSELDEDRRTALTGLVGESTQTFVTTTNLGYFDEEALSGALVVDLS